MAPAVIGACYSHSTAATLFSGQRCLGHLPYYHTTRGGGILLLGFSPEHLTHSLAGGVICPPHPCLSLHLCVALSIPRLLAPVHLCWSPLEVKVTPFSCARLPGNTAFLREQPPPPPDGEQGCESPAALLNLLPARSVAAQDCGSGGAGPSRDPVQLPRSY